MRISLLGGGIPLAHGKISQVQAVDIEVKAGATLGTNDIKGMKALAEIVGRRFHRGIALYGGQDTIPFGSGIHALPLSALWLEPTR